MMQWGNNQITLDNSWGKKQKEGKCIYNPKESTCWSHLVGKEGIARVQNGNLVFKPKKDPFGNNSYIVSEEDLDFSQEW